MGLSLLFVLLLPRKVAVFGADSGRPFVADLFEETRFGFPLLLLPPRVSVDINGGGSDGIQLNCVAEGVKSKSTDPKLRAY